MLEIVSLQKMVGKQCATKTKAFACSDNVAVHVLGIEVGKVYFALIIHSYCGYHPNTWMILLSHS